MKKVILVILLSLALLCGCGEVKEKHQYCEEDSDCEAVYTDCASCSCHGTPINKYYKEHFQEIYTNKCKNYKGPVCDVDCPYSAILKCSNNTCIWFDPAIPTESNTVTIFPGTIDVNVKETKDIKIGFFNPTINTEKWVMEISDDSGDECGQGTNGTEMCFNKIQTVYVVTPFILPKDEIKRWRAVFKPDVGAVDEGESEAEYLFTVKFCGKSDGTSISDCDEADIIHQEEFVMTVRR